MKKVQFILTVFISIYFLGCSGSIILKPDYEKEILRKNIIADSTNKKIIRVLDVRDTIPNLAGSAQVGLFNKRVPYYIEDTVSNFIEQAVNRIIYNDSSGMFIPINVVVDSFNVYEKTTLFSEKGNFDCSLRFFYPLRKDSIISVNTFVHLESSGLDVTNSLEDLIYQGVAECAKQFNEKFTERVPEYTSADKDIPLEINLTSITKSPMPADSLTLNAKNRYSNSLGMVIIQGSKIKTGFQLTYQEYNTFNNPHFAGGFGYCGSYYDIENTEAFLEGSFFSLNYRYSLRYFLSESQKGLYLSGGIKLSLGTESISYGSSSKTNFFIGPTVEEVLGISIAKKVFLEGGIFQIKHFGSDLMPDDFGYLFGIHVKI